MKSRSCRFALISLFAVSCIPAFSAAPAKTPARAFRLNAVEQHNQPAIEVGTRTFTVSRVLGEPRRKLNPDTWLYDNFQSSDWKVETGDCTTLLIGFVDGKVADLRLVNLPAEKIIAANLQTSSANGALVAKK